MRKDVSPRHAIIWVAETECCGLKVHSPADLAKPCHARRPVEDAHLPRNDSYPACKILRYWEFRAKRSVSPAIAEKAYGKA